jgi:hypothetical protein
VYSPFQQLLSSQVSLIPHFKLNIQLTRIIRHWRAASCVSFHHSGLHLLRPRHRSLRYLLERTSASETLAICSTALRYQNTVRSSWAPPLQDPKQTKRYSSAFVLKIATGTEN